MEHVSEKLGAIEDTRHSINVEHSLADVLIIMMSAITCGLDGLADIMVYAESKSVFYKEKIWDLTNMIKANDE